MTKPVKDIKSKLQTNISEAQRYTSPTCKDQYTLYDKKRKSLNMSSLQNELLEMLSRYCFLK